MKLWILEPREEFSHTGQPNPWDPYCDSVIGLVVRADSEESARALADKNGGAETDSFHRRVGVPGCGPWLRPEYSTCTELSVDGPACVILKDQRDC